jgi:hypothetical protein
MVGERVDGGRRLGGKGKLRPAQVSCLPQSGQKSVDGLAAGIERRDDEPV